MFRVFAAASHLSEEVAVAEELAAMSAGERPSG
jgi:hypothetical protein